MPLNQIALRSVSASGALSRIAPCAMAPRDRLRAATYHRLQHRTHHRHGEEAFEIAVAVPIHHRDGIARADPGIAQCIGQATDPGGQVADRVADMLRVQGFPLPNDPEAQDGIGPSPRPTGDGARGHGNLP